MKTRLYSFENCSSVTSTISIKLLFCGDVNSDLAIVRVVTANKLANGEDKQY